MNTKATSRIENIRKSLMKEEERKEKEGKIKKKEYFVVVQDPN